MYNRLVVSIVNYCDPEFYFTVKSLWDSAKNKDKLFFSLVSEDIKTFNFSFIPSNQIRYLNYDLSEYRGGLGWARNLASSIDIDYDYFIQFDSHTYAFPNWDTKAIAKYEKLKQTNDNFIIAYAPADYEILVDGVIDTNTGNTTSIFANDYSTLIPGFTFPSYKVLEIDEEVKSFWTTCCYLLAPKSWVDEVGISKYESFNTEEFSLSIRTFAAGWDIFSIGARDVFHHQSHRQPDGTITRQILRPWADERREDYWKHVQESTDRLSMLMSGKLDVPIEEAQQFFQNTGLSPKYLTFIPNYSSHVIIENRGFGMPPRRY
jgi:hypothetical protein